MRFKTSTELFIVSASLYAAACGGFLRAKKVYGEEIERIQGFWGLDFTPDLNSWHYAALVIFSIAVAVTIAGIWIKKRE